MLAKRKKRVVVSNKSAAISQHIAVLESTESPCDLYDRLRNRRPDHRQGNNRYKERKAYSGGKLLVAASWKEEEHQEPRVGLDAGRQRDQERCREVSPSSETINASRSREPNNWLNIASFAHVEDRERRADRNHERGPSHAVRADADP